MHVDWLQGLHHDGEELWPLDLSQVDIQVAKQLLVAAVVQLMGSDARAGRESEYAARMRELRDQLLDIDSLPLQRAGCGEVPYWANWAPFSNEEAATAAFGLQLGLDEAPVLRALLQQFFPHHQLDITSPHMLEAPPLAPEEAPEEAPEAPALAAQEPPALAPPTAAQAAPAAASPEPPRRSVRAAAKRREAEQAEKAEARHQRQAKAFRG
jgi:hypothetical protein